MINSETIQIFSILATLVLGILGLWLKFGAGTRKIYDKIQIMMDDNTLEHQMLNEKIEFNTSITREIMNKKDFLDKLNSIKIEALKWSPKELNKFIILKSHSMQDFFFKIYEIDFSKIDTDSIEDNIHIALGKLKTDGCDAIEKDFINYFYDDEFENNIKEYVEDLKRYKNGRINNLNEAFMTRSIVFYRHSLENLLTAWNNYLVLKEKYNLIKN